jgi:hypothetical protein
MTTSTETDCRSEEGVTVGLIDSMIAIARVLAPRLNMGAYSHPVAEALRDFWDDRDVRDVEMAATGIIRGFRNEQPKPKPRM